MKKAVLSAAVVLAAVIFTCLCIVGAFCVASNAQDSPKVDDHKLVAVLKAEHKLDGINQQMTQLQTQAQQMFTKLQAEQTDARKELDEAVKSANPDPTRFEWNEAALSFVPKTKPESKKPEAKK